MAITDDSARELVALAGVALGQTDLPSTLVEICRIATRAVPGADGASVTTFPEGRPGAVASDEWARSLDELQYVEHEGPCLDAFRTGNTFRIRDLAEDARWPSYTPRAVERGARSMMSLAMPAQGSIVGALNIYSRQPDRFDADAASVAEIAVAHAALATEVSVAYFRHRDLAEQMREAMASRATIEQAKGVIMARHRCDPDSAFDLLVQQSQTTNRKLRDVADELVARVSGG